MGSDKLLLSTETDAESTAEDAATPLRSAHPGLVITAGAVEGKPGEAMMRIAESLGADLIVVGNRRVQGVARVFGSIAREFAAHASCDLYIVNTHQRAGGSDGEPCSEPHTAVPARDPAVNGLSHDRPPAMPTPTGPRRLRLLSQQSLDRLGKRCRASGSSFPDELVVDEGVAVDQDVAEGDDPREVGTVAAVSGSTRLSRFRASPTIWNCRSTAERTIGSD